MVSPFTTSSTFAHFNPHTLHERFANDNLEYRTRFADRSRGTPTTAGYSPTRPGSRASTAAPRSSTGRLSPIPPDGDTASARATTG